MNHIAAFNNLSDYFRITYICDVSAQALTHCVNKVGGKRPYTTSRAEDVCSSDEVDVVVICNSTAFHPSHTILALNHGKFVFVEKPLAICFRDIDAIIEAEKKSKGAVFVGYQRRYAEAFLDAVAEVGGMKKIQYARVRGISADSRASLLALTVLDIIGHNSTFVGQSATFPRKFNDIRKEDSEMMADLDNDMVAQALEREFRVKATSTSRAMLGLLGG